MKTRLGWSLGLALALSGGVRADEITITGFQNGQLTWTNSNPNALWLYTVEWASSLNSSNWQSTWTLPPMFFANGPTTTVEVPMFYRVKGFGFQEVTDTNVLNTMFANAVANAQHPTADKICRELTAITTNTAGLSWSNGMVLMATFTRTYDYPSFVGQAYTNGFGDTWVAPPYELKRQLQSYPGTNVLLRLNQLLGMPYYTKDDMMVELWVDPKIMFRPSADPEITDHEAQVDFSYTNAYVSVSPSYYSWYTNQVAANTYPWTRLGYTYDWGNPTGQIIGVSEFVIPKNSVFIINSITPAVEYFRRQ
jgi:hypothetical protein